jgi:colanic acid/amylovoran biosynthesis protein
VLVPHVTGPAWHKDDRVISAELLQRLRGTVEAHVLTGDHRPEELKAMIARCTAFLGARMHANIAALSSCVPTVALSYSHKTPGIMASCGMGQFVAPIESVSVATLGDLVARTFTHRDEVAAVLRERMPGMRAGALQNIRLLRTLASAAQTRP